MNTGKHDEDKAHPQSGHGQVRDPYAEQHPAAGSSAHAAPTEPPTFPQANNEYGEKNPGYIAAKKTEKPAKDDKAAEHKDDGGKAHADDHAKK